MQGAIRHAESRSDSPMLYCPLIVTDWAKLHTAELQADWDLAQALAPLVPIDPLP